MFTYRHSRFATGLLVATALLGAACRDATSSDVASGNPTPSFSRSSHSEQGASAGFSVLANAAVSCTGGTVSGDVGTFQTAPPGAITLTEGCLIPGAKDIGGAAAKAAYQSFLDQYAALAPKAGDVCPVITGTLAGQSLSPGTYCVSSRVDAQWRLECDLADQGPVGCAHQHQLLGSAGRRRAGVQRDVVG